MRPRPATSPPPSSQLQARLRRSECAVERWHRESEECRLTSEECRREIEKMNGERARLSERIAVIDADIKAVREGQFTVHIVT